MITLSSRQTASSHILFTRRFRELIALESQGEVAGKLGFTQSRVSQIARGEKPSRQFVERLIETYELDREEWLALAGYSRDVSPDPTAELIQRAADEAVRKMVKQMKEEEQEQETPQQWLERGISGLEKEIGQTISIDYNQEGYQNMTYTHAAEILADLREVLQKDDWEGNPLDDTK